MAHETLRIPCPDLRFPQRFAGLYVLERRRLIEARSIPATQAAAARLAHYIARRSARADGYTPGRLLEVRAIESSRTFREELVCLRAEIEATPDDTRPWRP